MSSAFPRTALLAVSDATGIVELAQGLKELGWAILSSGATAKTLKDAGCDSRDAADLTGAPDILSGRLRLLHPRLLGGLVADRQRGEDMRELDRQKIPPIDLVAVNLFPIASVLERESLGTADLLEFLDISGSALLRAGARNFPHVITLCDPADYSGVLAALKGGKGLTRERSQSLAAKAYYYASYYDSTVAQHLSGTMEKLPDEMVIGLKKAQDLGYGENPHQQAAVYRRSGARPWGLQAADVASGKPLTFAHYLSLDRAAELVAEFQEPACAIITHANPAGAAIGPTAAEAARAAYRSDPEGCSGGVAAFNREIDAEAASVLAAETLECVAAPAFSSAAMDIFRAKKDCRLVRLPPLLLSPNEIEMKSISGGLILQDKDNAAPENPRSVGARAPNDLESAAAALAWKTAKHALTHAAVLAGPLATLGIGAGQTSRMDALRLAVVKSQERHPVVRPDQPTAYAADGAIDQRHVAEAAGAGVSVIIQPGGTSVDREAVRAADAAGVAMIFTGVRHFRH